MNLIWCVYLGSLGRQIDKTRNEWIEINHEGAIFKPRKLSNWLKSKERERGNKTLQMYCREEAHKRNLLQNYMKVWPALVYFLHREHASFIKMDTTANIRHANYKLISLATVLLTAAHALKGHYELVVYCSHSGWHCMYVDRRSLCTEYTLLF